MLKMTGKIFKQKNIGKQWGMFAQVAAQISIFVGMLNLLLISVTAYNTTLSPWFAAYGIHLQLWMFVVIIAGFLGVMSILLYKFALPSVYSFWNDQFYRHDNLMREDIETLKKDSKQIRETNEEILKILKERKENAQPGEEIGTKAG